MVEQQEKPKAEEVAAVITGSTHIPSPAHTKVESGIISVCSYKRRLCSAAVRELCSAAEQDNHDNAGVQGNEGQCFISTLMFKPWPGSITICPICLLSRPTWEMVNIYTF